MTLDQALYEMELVGHDFYLFVDKESERPSVVYRRRGYDYGVISLELDAELTSERVTWPAGQLARPCHDACRDEPNTTETGEPIRRAGGRRPGAVPPRADDAARQRGRASRWSARPVTVSRAPRWPRRVAPDVVLLDVRMPKLLGHRGLPGDQGERPVGQDHHAHRLRRGGRPLRGRQERRLRLPAQGLLDRGGRPGDPGGGRRPVADQPVDGGEADRRVQADVAAREEQRPGAAAHRARARGAAAASRPA